MSERDAVKFKAITPNSVRYIGVLQRKRQLENYGLEKRKAENISHKGQRETSNLQSVRKVEKLVVERI